MPIPSKLSSNTSVLSALLPEISIEDIDGLSATVIIKEFPSRPI